jgi:hypothetical protein
MQYESYQKELVFSGKVAGFSADFLQKLEEECCFYGTATRVDSKMFRGNSFPFRVSVYRPDQLSTGVEVAVRVLKKRDKRGFYHKIVVIPVPDRSNEFNQFPAGNLIECVFDHVGACHESMEEWAAIAE